MIVSAPHFLLFSESQTSRAADSSVPRGHGSGQWRFVLETVDGGTRFEAADEELDSEEGRLALLAVVRGLEALEQPSRVTVVTPSRYVSRGFLFGLEEWRENGWRWERFGEMAPIKNRDLWQRIDRAMQYHHVECRVWRFDMPETSDTSPSTSPAPAARSCSTSPKQRKRPRPRQHSVKPSGHAAASWGQKVRDLWQRCRTRLRGGFRLEAA
jgi:ribonuclease HI